MRAVETIRELLRGAVARRGWQWPEKANIEPPKSPEFGDLASNLALMLASRVGARPRDLAAELAAELEAAPQVEKIEVAGPGFLNFFLTKDFWRSTISDVLSRGENYGASDTGTGRRVQVEYVSANPTGPLHIGHGRGAALGDSLARMLRFAGFEVETEYYVNDAGRQMHLLGTSIWVRYRQELGRAAKLPEDCYQGDYIAHLARELVQEYGEGLEDMDRDQALDICRKHGHESILAGIKEDLAAFRVHHQVWFSEAWLVETGAVERTLESLRAKGLAYEKDGALWFESTRFGDDKDRVLKKSDGSLTYFASDIAYHADKYGRGFDLVVNVWGADHHGYVPRMKAAAQALGRDAQDLQIILVQLVNLLRAGEQVAMSTRSGQFETLADVVREVGADAARFIFLTRKSDSHLDFDLELVKQQTMDNPVYYVQYAHARINSVFAKAADRGIGQPTDQADLHRLLDTAEDMDLLKAMERFPDVVAQAAQALAPHHVGFYLRDLAGLLHRYYTMHSVLAASSPDLVQARLLLLRAVGGVLRCGLGLMGVTAPQSM
jgi:arginyl-tRNA synthetase